MTSTGDRDKLDEGGGEALGDKDHGGGQDDGGQLVEAQKMTGAQGAMTVRSAMVLGKLLEASSGCGRACVGPGAEIGPIFTSTSVACWR
jgi:hypothetical protein